MSELLQTNIFFFITSVAVIFVTALIIVVLVYLVLILRNVRDVSRKMKRGSDILGEDLSSLRDTIKEDSTRLRDVISSFIGRLFFGRKSSKKKKHAKEKT